MIGFIIYTYDRPCLLTNLLKSIDSNLPNEAEISVYIFDDCSHEKQIFQNESFKFLIKYHKFKRNHGRHKWFQLMNYIYKFLEQEPEFEYYFFLNDDMEFVENGVSRSIDIYNSINHPRKIALNLHHDERGPKSKWQTLEPRPYNDQVWKTSWTDTSFLCQIDFLKELEWRIPKDKFFKIVRNQDCGSGVGMYLSKTLSLKGKRFFLVNQSLVIHKSSHESKMNPEERKKHPLVSI